MKACVLNLLVLICFTVLAESRSTVDETVKELLRELKLLESIKHNDAKTDQVKVPPGAHEVPGDENGDDKPDDDHHPLNLTPTSDDKPDDNNPKDGAIKNDKPAKDDGNENSDNEDDDHRSDDDEDDDEDDNDDDDDKEVKLPPGAHEVPAEDNVTDSCKPGEDCKKPDNNNSNQQQLDINERILLHLAESKNKQAFKEKSNFKATQNLVLSIPEPYKLTCGKPAIKPDVSQKIVNGKPATPHSWPWQISLRLLIGNKQYHICGGSIVTKNVIITAAHCCFDEYRRPFDKSQFVVVAGDYDQLTSSDGPTQTSKVNFLYVHKSYNPKYSNSSYDIAAIVLQTPLTFNNHISPVCLPTGNPTLNSLCYATGWGKTQGNGVETILNQVRLPIVSQTICAQKDHNGPEIIDSKLCAGFERGGGDACQGDSGGPFVCYNQLNSRWYLHGVTSYGAGCGLPKKPGVYTRIYSYLRWIYQITKKLSLESPTEDKRWPMFGNIFH